VDNDTGPIRLEDLPLVDDEPVISMFLIVFIRLFLLFILQLDRIRRSAMAEQKSCFLDIALRKTGRLHTVRFITVLKEEMVCL
jgi:uncharacterized membrane protein YobD (UPF0266 family)